jgi:RimJ/RimL family protein N-acetyltransferase
MWIREATQKDVPDLAEVHLRTWQGAYPGLMPQEFLDSRTVEEFMKRWTQIISNQNEAARMTFVADAGNRAVGFVSAGPCRDEGVGASTGEIRAIYVLPKFWSTGAGRALMARGLDFLHERGYTVATLWVLRGNSRARRFYERAGMTLEGAERIDARLGFDMQEVRYRIELPRQQT